MNRSIRKVAGVLSVGTAVVGIVLSGTSSAWAQQNTADLKKQVVGGWTLVSAVAEQGGTKQEPWTSNPRGFISFDQEGNFSIINVRPDLRKIASNNRQSTTPDESKAIAQGVLAYYGRYTVNENDGSINFTIRGSTFPNWLGSEQKRFITVTADDMRLFNSTPQLGGGTATLMYKRAK